MSKGFRQIGTLLFALFLVISFSGCTGQAPDTKKEASNLEEPVIVASVIPEGYGVVPYVKGMKGDLALKIIQEYGLTASIEDYGSLERVVEEPSDWTIVSQPEPGVQYERGHKISLFAMNLDDTLDFLGDIESLKKMELTEGYKVLPNFRGMSLAKAKEILDAMGLREYSDDASLENRSIYIDSNWVVADQDDPSGSLVELGRTIILRVLKTGEKFKPVIEKREIHWQETQWYGKVTGNVKEREMFSSNLGYVQIDGLNFDLDLIDVLDDSCQVENLDEIAVREKLSLLPVGTEVRVAQTSGDKVVLHLSKGDDLSRPLDNSVQEQLVKMGYWIADDYRIDDPSLGFDSKSIFKIEEDPYIDGLAFKYLQILVETSNQALKNRIGGLNNCYITSVKYEKEQARIRAEWEAWSREYERTHPWFFGGWGGGGSCAGGARDGDGDGICNEG
jgi:hypothetical protein